MEANSYDMLLQGGHVIDPAGGINQVLDIAVKNGKISRIEANLPIAAANQVIDLAGLYITPGLIDIHTHVYKFRPISTSYVESVNADAHMLASGVTTTVDTGTAGWEHFLDFKEGTIDRSTVRILAFLNIARQGMVNAESEQVAGDMQPEIASALVRAYPDVLVGIKSAHYWTRLPWDDSHRPWTSIERAIEAGALCDRPVMVDFWPRPPERPYPELLLQRLRPGDIHTHLYAQQFPVLDERGAVSDFLFQARERGVWFDLGHGAASFWFRNAAPAIRQGFPPDTISTDLHMANVAGPVISMQHTMSKLLNLGMPLQEVIYRSTVMPARLIRRAELGTLRPGAEADIAVFRLMEGSFGFADCGKARLTGSQKLECMLTLRAGRIVFDPMGRGLPDWENAPQPYWRVPQIQPY